MAAQGARPELAATMGTSYSAPLTLRTAGGIRAILGEAVHPLTIKALMIHSAECPKESNPDEIGWGRALTDLGIPGVILFGIPERKDAEGSGAWDDDGAVQLEG